MWKKYVFPDGTPFYFNDFTGYITLEFPQKPRPPKGGILADDQGLGKTIQVTRTRTLNSLFSNIILQDDCINLAE